ncbi:MAG: 30S ribosomal protein S21 [Patescibacteria group bacterium]
MIHNIKITKKNNESAASLLRRFTRAVKSSGFLLNVRHAQRKERSKSEYTRKKEALRRLAWQKNMERQRKLGEIE